MQYTTKAAPDTLEENVERQVHECACPIFTLPQLRVFA